MLLSDVEAVRRFNTCDWLGYFLSLTTFDDEAASKFTRMFDEGEASIWGLTVIATEECIAEVIGFPTIREHYPNTHDARSTRAQFVRPIDPHMYIKKQGYKRMSLLPPYNELAMHIIRYLTCEGRFSYLHAHILNFSVV